MHKKLVIVADGSRAQFLSAKGRKLHSIVHEMKNKDLGTHDTRLRKEGRTEGGHFYDPHSSIKCLEKECFAKDLSQEIKMRMIREAFDSIILVASPQMLGMLRKQLNSHITVDRSLCLEATHLNIEQLEDRIFD
ncbi:MAG: host attachment protein [Alphaproteobacteria bacterium]|nr:host attachment protein [Alphaproteobacteria bacterium]NCQ66678.1 host attachment protein [Alphaproteobacteria bacterium]NCT07129.1 host attachment protein [Alphaproteobacteria bacterium]